jgi:pyruvate-ferredoxin/flavodoxin oxidoreductase
MRKELSLLAIAHRTSFVLQTSQASHSHLLAGVLRGLASRRPAVFNIYTPCPPEHGLADHGSAEAARLALESRAFPFLVYDPDEGPCMADRLDLQGNPMLEDRWPNYELTYKDDQGARQTMTLPVTIADWAAAETRFARHFRKVDRSKWSDDMVPFHEYLDLSAEKRAEKKPFIYTIDDKRRLDRLLVSDEIVELAEERLSLWTDLKQMAGTELSPSARESALAEVKQEYETREASLRAEYEAQLAAKGSEEAHVVVNRIVEGLFGNGGARGATALSRPASSDTGATPLMEGAAAPAVEPVAEAPEEEGEALPSDPYINSVLCTTCNECTNLNPRMFAYDADKHATLKDPSAGTFQELVRAAELCPPAIIHPGTPLNPNEKNLDQWVERAKPFNGQ